MYSIQHDDEITPYVLSQTVIKHEKTGKPVATVTIYPNGQIEYYSDIDNEYYTLLEINEAGAVLTSEPVKQ